MHRGHDHDHDHHQGNGAAQGESHPASHGGVGHNHPHRPRNVAQWQTPHLDRNDHVEEPEERDIDKVEAAFMDRFIDAPDPTSFLRLAHIPFEIAAADGSKLSLLRVEINVLTDVGSVTPHLGGASFRYDPLPASLVSPRRQLRFVYFDGQNVRLLSFAEVRAA